MDGQAEIVQGEKPIRFCFLLLPGFSLISFSAAIEPFHKVNKILKKTIYSPVLLSVDGTAVTSSSAVKVEVDGSLSEIDVTDALFICGSSSLATDDENEVVVSWLRQARTLPQVLGGIASGSNILAKAGLLNGVRAVSCGQGVKGCYPEVHFTHNLFELDGHRYTCGGGSAAMDMMLALIAKQQSLELSAIVAELMIRDRRGETGGVATTQARGIKAGPEPKLREALDLMLANIEEPLGADELAAHVGISRRQLERLFRKKLDAAPSKYYLQLRLEEARKLLRDGDMPVVQVALATGFSNASHFSTAYRNHFNITPREERQQSRDGHLNELKHSLPA